MSAMIDVCKISKSCGGGDVESWAHYRGGDTWLNLKV